MCCALSWLSISLASAGNLCWAKPNHGFFSCQQPAPIFFGAAAAAFAACGAKNDRLMLEPTAWNANRFFLLRKKPPVLSGFHCMSRDTDAAPTASTTGAAGRLGDVPAAMQAQNYFFAASADCAPHKPICAKLRKKIRASRRCRTGARNKKPASYPRRGFLVFRSSASANGVPVSAALSSTRRPAPGRRHPDPPRTWSRWRTPAARRRHRGADTRRRARPRPRSAARPARRRLRSPALAT